MTDQEQLQRRIRRNALLLGLFALVLYVSYYLIQLSRTAG